MSIQRYTYVGNDIDDIENNVDGEYVKHSDHTVMVDKQTVVFAEEIIRLKNLFDTQVEQLEKQVEFEYNLKVQARTQWDDLSKHIEELENQLNNK